MCSDSAGVFTPSFYLPRNVARWFNSAREYICHSSTSGICTMPSNVLPLPSVHPVPHISGPNPLVLSSHFVPTNFCQHPIDAILCGSS